MAAENTEQPENLTFEEFEKQSGERLSKDFGSLLRNPAQSDLTIVCGEGQSEREFPVHKLILGARSSDFDGMIVGNEETLKDNKLVFNDIDPKVMEALLLYIYSAKLPRVKEFAPELLAVAKRFHLDGLRKMAQQQVSTNGESNEHIGNGAAQEHADQSNGKNTSGSSGGSADNENGTAERGIGAEPVAKMARYD